MAFEQSGDRPGEALSALRQHVLGVGRATGDQATLEDALRLELLEALRERRRRDPRQRLAELVSVGGEASAARIDGATLKVYPGAPHGITDTHKARLGEDLLEFLGVP